MEEISRTIELEQEEKSTKWFALIATPGNRRRTLIAVYVSGFAQRNGVAVVSYYLTLVLDTVSVTDTDTQALINGILQIFNFAAAVSAAFLVDRLGQRILFIWSGAGMLISFVVWTSLRSQGLIVELLTVYGSLINLSFVNPIALDNIGWHYYIVFCCLPAVFFVVTFFLFPETKGYRLEEIAEVFDGPNATKHALGAAAIQSAKVEDDSDYMENETVHNETAGKY